MISPRQQALLVALVGAVVVGGPVMVRATLRTLGPARGRRSRRP
jgi:hypothetical protein